MRIHAWSSSGGLAVISPRRNTPRPTTPGPRSNYTPSPPGATLPPRHPATPPVEHVRTALASRSAPGQMNPLRLSGFHRQHEVRWQPEATATAQGIPAAAHWSDSVARIVPAGAHCSSAAAGSEQCKHPRWPHLHRVHKAVLEQPSRASTEASCL